MQEVQQILIETLAQFGIAVAPGDITKGPTITRYEVYPAKGVRVDKIVSPSATLHERRVPNESTFSRLFRAKTLSESSWPIRAKSR